MYNVSEAYKTEMRQEVRNFSYMKIKFGVTDPDALRYGYVSATSSKLAYSSEPDLVDEKNVSRRYGTLEPGFWLLDGSKNTFPTNAGWQGFVSTGLSNDAGVISSPAFITIKFKQGDYYRFFGLTFRFDVRCQEWPENVTIKSYQNGTLIDTQTHTVDNYEFVVESGIPAGEDTYLDTLVVEFSKTRIPRRRFRLEGITLGVYKNINESRIINAEWSRSNDLMNTTAPIDEFNFSFYDEERFYNPENPSGIWSYLDAGQQITTQYGYELDDGSIEWVPGGSHYTNGAPTVDDSGVLSQVSFKAVSRIQSLNDVYEAGIYNDSGVTLYQLAVDVLTFMDLKPVDYVLSNSLKSYSTKAPLPVLTARELLQLIANAGMCVLYVNRNNQIVFETRNNSTVQDFTFNNDCVYDAQPTLKKYPVLKELTTVVHRLVKGAELEELATVDIETATGEIYTVDYEMGTGIQITVSTGLTLNQTYMIGSYRAKVQLTGSGTVTVKGYPINDYTYSITNAFNVKGDPCSVDNQLITHEGHCRLFNSWLASVLSRRNQYHFEERGFPEIDIADNVLIDTYYVAEGQATVVANKISYNGALKAETEVLGI
nr:MAG TPA: hypothetical protein [Caudoviricetes sp.]